MIRVLLFTKDRPMQCEAFLESLRFYCGESVPVDIIVDKFDHYNELIKQNRNWHWWTEAERKFSDVLDSYLSTIANDDIIITCVDDCVFFRYINLENLKCLNQQEYRDVIGFTLRLGTNIYPYSQNWNESKFKPYSKFKWQGKPSHFGYPFELSCTGYRASFLKEVFNQFSTKIRLPNDYEAMGVVWTVQNKYQELPYFMMFNNAAASSCVDINRVQSLYPNKTEGGNDLTSEKMLEMYKQGKRIDWANYYNMNYPNCFIGTNNLRII